jgi:hypothetical protein
VVEWKAVETRSTALIKTTNGARTSAQHVLYFLVAVPAKPNRDNRDRKGPCGYVTWEPKRDQERPRNFRRGGQITRPHTAARRLFFYGIGTSDMAPDKVFPGKSHKVLAKPPRSPHEAR